MLPFNLIHLCQAVVTNKKRTLMINKNQITLNNRSIFVYLTPAIFVLLWSTGFIGAKFGLPYAEPFTFLFIRFAIASVLLSILSLFLRASWPRKPLEIVHIAISGLLLHALYLGGVFMAIKLGMSAGLTALIVGLQPILTGIFAQILLKEKVVFSQILGLLLGFIGVVMVVSEKIFSFNTTQKTWPIAALIAAIIGLLGTTFGVLYQKRYCPNMQLTTGTTIQYFSTCSVLLILALTFEEMKVQWTREFVFALFWLILVLSLGAISLLIYLIRHQKVSRLTSLFYLVPPATAIQEFFLFEQRLTPVSLLGMLVVIMGVAIVIYKK